MINGYGGNNWGYSVGGSASMRALQTMARYSDSAYGATGLTSPILDVVSLGDPFSSGFNDVAQMKELARRMQVMRNMGGQAPSDLLAMPTDKFFGVMNQQLAVLSKLKAAQGASKGKDAKNANSTGSPLQVRAHERFDSEGNRVPVTSVRVQEAGAGKYNTRQNTYNPGNNSQTDAVYGNAKEGGYYTVTVTWADGTVEQQRVQNQGWQVDIW